MKSRRRLLPRKEPRQDRSRETVKAILEAAARILEKHGLEGYNTNAVAQRAGISIGSLYQYFPGKDALTLALIAEFEADLSAKLRAAAQAAQAAKDLRQALRALVRALVKAHVSRGELNRLLEAEEDRLGSPAADGEAGAELEAVFGSVLKAHRSSLPEAASAEMVRDSIAIARAMADAMLRARVPARAAEHRILRAVEGYLRFAG